MQSVPTLELIFAFFLLFMGDDTASLTVTRGYSDDDPITWTRIKPDVWKVASRKGVSYGTWHYDYRFITVKMDGKFMATELRKYSIADFDSTGVQQGVSVLDHKIQCTWRGDEVQMWTTNGGIFDSPVVARRVTYAQKRAMARKPAK